MPYKHNAPMSQGSAQPHDIVRISAPTGDVYKLVADVLESDGDRKRRIMTADGETYNIGDVRWKIVSRLMNVPTTLALGEGSVLTLTTGQPSADVTNDNDDNAPTADVKKSGKKPR